MITHRICAHNQTNPVCLDALYLVPYLPILYSETTEFSSGIAHVRDRRLPEEALVCDPLMCLDAGTLRQNGNLPTSLRIML